MFKKEATSALAGFQAASLSWLKWNLEMLVFGGRNNIEHGEKLSDQGKNQLARQSQIVQCASDGSGMVVP